MHTDFKGWQTVEKVKRAKTTKTAVAGEFVALDKQQIKFLKAIEGNVQKVLSDGDQRYLYALCLQLQDVLPSYLVGLSQRFSVCDDCLDDASEEAN
jgi:hypothetical protein